MKRGDVQSLAPYLAAGAFVWLSLLEAGVHATLAGVALGLLTPAWPLRSPRRFAPAVRSLANDIDRAYYDHVITGEEFAEGEQRIAELGRLAMYSTSPLERLERALSPWVAYVVVPVFALANAGVELSGDAISGLASEPITLGILLGLVVGKTVGVFGASVVAIRLGVGRLPVGATWRHMLGLAMVAGVGFTVALFVTSISFDDPVRSDAAKIGILAGSALAGLLGYGVLRTARPPLTTDETSVLPAAVDAGAERTPVPAHG